MNYWPIPAQAVGIILAQEVEFEKKNPNGRWYSLDMDVFFNNQSVTEQQCFF